MSGIRLHFETSSTTPGSEPILVEIFDRNLESRLVETQSDVDNWIPVEPGRYLVKARLSDGRRVESKVTVPADGDVELTLKPPPVEVPDPRRKVSVGNLRARESFTFAVADAGMPEATVSVPQQMPRLPRREFLSYWPGTWARLWRRSAAGWEAAEFDMRNSEELDWSVRYRVGVAGAVTFVQVGGPDIAWRFMALPDEVSVVEFSVKWAGDEPRLEIGTMTQRPDVQSFLGFLTRGDLRAADILASSLMAERMLRSKMAAPRVAALGAYYLLKVGDLEKLHDWPRNLADWMDWLPDGPVIQAWQLIRGKGTDAALADARTLLLTAVERGIPVYTEGMRLLWDGLRLYHDEDPRDPAVNQALEAMRPYAAAVHWEAPTTTFGGESPDAPTRRQFLGIPDPPDVSFLY